MAQEIPEFFAQLQRRGIDPLLAKASGTVRFDIADGEDVETWFVQLHGGEIDVTRQSDEDVTSTVRCSKRLFESICSGSTNAMAAMLRNEMTLDGNAELLLLLGRVFPGPATSTHPRAVTGVDA
jgi:hypothetical protein